MSAWISVAVSLQTDLIGLRAGTKFLQTNLGDEIEDIIDDDFENLPVDVRIAHDPGVGKV